MGLGPIPWTAIESYGRANSFDESTFVTTEYGTTEENLMEDLHYFITMMDSAYLKWSAKKSESK